MAERSGSATLGWRGPIPLAIHSCTMTDRQDGPAVVLVGRPNVGKSTLFNRITGTRRSIVAPVAGTTRDTLAAPADWRDRHFTLIDTGGLFGATTDPLHRTGRRTRAQGPRVGRRHRLRRGRPRGDGAWRRADRAAGPRTRRAGAGRRQQDGRQARAESRDGVLRDGLRAGRRSGRRARRRRRGPARRDRGAACRRRRARRRSSRRRRRSRLSGGRTWASRRS